MHVSLRCQKIKKKEKIKKEKNILYDINCTLVNIHNVYLSCFRGLGAMVCNFLIFSHLLFLLSVEELMTDLETWILDSGILYN